MSLWQDDEYTDDESAKAARVQERDAFFNVEDTTDRSVLLLNFYLDGAKL
jgi:hypothetical protein